MLRTPPTYTTTATSCGTTTVSLTGLTAPPILLFAPRFKPNADRPTTTTLPTQTGRRCWTTISASVAILRHSFAEPFVLPQTPTVTLKGYSTVLSTPSAAAAKVLRHSLPVPRTATLTLMLSGCWSVC